jgi:hypothetical protein
MSFFATRSIQTARAASYRAVHSSMRSSGADACYSHFSRSPSFSRTSSRHHPLPVPVAFAARHQQQQQQPFPALQRRGIQTSVAQAKTLDFGGTQERVYARSDWPLSRLQAYFARDTLAVIGYGSQGHGQGLNLRDHGLNVIVGVREGGQSWKDAVADGWVRVLFPVPETKGMRGLNVWENRSLVRTCSRLRRRSGGGRWS